jgi:thiol-disulfide isomerase/thioredoxin
MNASANLTPHVGSAAVLALLLLLLGTAHAGAQETRLQGMRGEHLGDTDLARGTTILVFWTSWSPHSRDIVARVNPLIQRWGGHARIITVNFQEDRPTIEGFLSGKDLGVPVFLDSDGSFARKYAVAALPGLLIVRDGQVIYKGRLPEDANRVIADFLGG